VTVILVTGRTGQVGRELVRCLQPLGHVVATGRQELDLRDPDSIRNTVREVSPHIVVNAAAYTGVDQAESEPELAMQVNGIGPGVLAEEAKRANALLIHYSTDYVFDGALGRPYVEEDAPSPLNVYGRTKLEGERTIAAVGGAYVILRTSWIYSDQPPNFVLTMLKLAEQKPEVDVVNDQVGSPTWARSLAAATAEVLRQAERARKSIGIYHLSASDYTTRFAFAKGIFDLAEQFSPGRVRQPILRPIATAAYPLPADRPLNCPTSKEKVKSVFGVEMADWRAQLVACMKHLFSTLQPDAGQRGKN
jgi:dTDP-4-dehydrorhamnose reductase